MTAKVGQPGLLRRTCLYAANVLFQFPPTFELQQWLFRQPTPIRREIEEDMSSLCAQDGNVRILDYGCGGGSYAGLISSQHYCGVDSSARMIAWARHRYPHHTFIHASNLASIRSHLGKISFILLIGVVHHLHDREVVQLLSDLPCDAPVRILAIDTLRLTGGVGALIQLFERGQFLRSEHEYRNLLGRVAREDGYHEVPYGRYLKMAVFRGSLHPGLGGLR
ncbi:MAG: class I SAM-dependent methyltransferase [Acidobacteria bacterium]|nr:class I SAM-dependent methyltransferase [Acidobacteriota bacterium]